MTRDGRKWLFIIGGILGTTVAVNMILVAAALSNGGPAPIPDAYEKALHWDSLQAQRAETQALGWQVNTRVDGSSSAQAQEIRIEIQDGSGHPVALDRGEIRLSRPSDDAPTQDLTLAPAGNGVYLARAVLADSGLWQLDLALDRGQERFRGSVRTEVH